MNRLRLRYRALSPASRRVFWIITALAALLAFLSVATLQSLLLADETVEFITNLISPALTLIFTISAISLLYNRVQFGIWFFFIGTLIAMLVVPFTLRGIAFPASTLILIVTVLVPLQIVTGRKATFALVSSLIAISLIITIDTFWTGARTNVAARDVPALRATTIALGLILLVTIWLLYPTFNLRAKLLTISLGASVLSIIAVAGVSLLYAQAAFSKNTQEKLLTAARNTAAAIDADIVFNMELIKTEASLPILSRYLSASGANRPGPAELREAMQNLAQRDTKNIRSYALLDNAGITLWDTRAFDTGLNQASQDFFTAPFTTGRVYVSPLRLAAEQSESAFYISAPVFYPDSNLVLGVLLVEFRASFFEDVLKNNSGAAGPTSYAILLDEYNLILADPEQPELVARTPSLLNEKQVEFLKTQKRLPSNANIAEISLEMSAFAKGLNNMNTTPFFKSGDMAFDGTLQGAIVYVSRQPWKVAFVQQESVVQAPIEEQTRAIVAAALAIGFLLGVATLFLSRAITNPVARLTQAAEEILSGNLNVRAEVHSRDELGTLASTLNSMSGQLNQTLAGLETAVAERTADLEQRGQELLQRSNELEQANKRSEQRAAQLMAVSSVSNAITTIQNLDDLLPLITRTISEKFGFYHVGIFLNDASSQYTVLRATNSDGGQRMLQRGHRLKIGETGIVGDVVAVGRPYIASDTGKDVAHFNNPDLPETRSEMALPLRAGPNIIGALDVQSKAPEAFTEEDIEILSALAGQVSAAIRNAHLFDQTQRSTAELQVLLQQDAREQWQQVIRSEKQAGYYYDGTALTPLTGPVEKDDNMILIPVTVRGQTIGNLGIRPPANRSLNPDELDVIKAVSERLAISAENARLLEESQRRAVKEQTVGEISAKIGASMNIENILQTAVEELGRTLTGTQVSIRLKSDKRQEQ